MKTYTFHNEIKVILAQVLNALGDLVIKRLDEDNDDGGVDRVHVNLVYAPKQRIIQDMVNKNQHFQLPIMSITIGSLSYDNSRAFNKIMGFTLSQQYLSGGGSFPEPVPIKLDLNFSVLVRFQRDLDQIITGLFSNFFPYIVISYKHPDTGHEVRCAVMWNGQINFNYPNDIAANVPFRITADSSFTVYAWIYRNASNPYGIIHNIPTTFTSVSNIFDDYYTMKTYESPITTDYFVVSGRPQINNISPYVANIGVTGMQFDILGDMFQFVQTIVLSATPQTVFPLSSYQLMNPFVSSQRLSSVYTAFSAVPLLTSDWYIVNDHNARFTLPVTQTSGYVEVYAISPMGIGRLTVDSMRPTTNPYPVGVEGHDTYVEFQLPVVSGIQIL